MEKSYLLEDSRGPGRTMIVVILSAVMMAHSVPGNVPSDDIPPEPCDPDVEPCCPVTHGPMIGWDEEDLKKCGLHDRSDLRAE